MPSPGAAVQAATGTDSRSAMNAHASMNAAASESPILLAEDLRKSYGARPALQGLSFGLHAGRVLGFLGPNGAGKTTAIRILTTILEPSSGRFVVDGLSSEQPEEIRRRIGVLPESLGFPKQNTALEYLTYYGRLYGRGAAAARARAEALLGDVGLQQRARSLIGTYSRGMRQRLGIARALVNDPAVVFLDEPTLGLDPRGQSELLAMVRRIARERNAGVVLCSHLLSEIEQVCDDVVILNAGQVIASGSVGEVIGQAQGGAVNGNQVRVRVPSLAVARAREVLEEIPEVVAVSPSTGSAGWLEVQVLPSADGNSPTAQRVGNRVLDAMIRAEIPVLGFETAGGRLQDAFLHLTEGGIR
jgi:ABC-2 type transport system ATP-binding protein